jgi:hypothetical protein
MNSRGLHVASLIDLSYDPASDRQRYSMAKKRIMVLFVIHPLGPVPNLRMLTFVVPLNSKHTDSVF